MTLEETIVKLLRSRQQTVSVAESCTGGLLGDRLTNVPGSSAVFPGGVLAYHNQPKRDLLGVPAEVLEREGAVSAACATAMAAGVRRLIGTDYALAITGIAGPTGGSATKPAGTVYIALAAPTGRVESYCFPGERLTYKLEVTDAALRLLLGELEAAGN
ncbi:MAG: CinA family protein [Dehalococcoidia bacterium]